ncbi:UDP-glucose--hexose-1-phosphate uridylyltransferase [Clostridium grantii]|uniref:Galactose-1-phosphate uridylyltransferase n=1 Tax=Clostridium grantii DSM 8605 TaxID=1121316 RepID=A0A1M5UHZ9_9CLOT|nr:UDP-glucose--hexose-1-phosphate uridylyltransferase [Clostridium grantii]SHH62635.1 UTP-hexose-1-phosphate uridylyltransferase [Clostridium grantii DSM 8605]
MNINFEIERLIQYALHTNLITESDKIYSRNRVLSILNLDSSEEVTVDLNSEYNLSDILDNILNWSFENNLLESNSPVYRDLLDAEIMNCFMPRPSEVINTFNVKYSSNPESATDYFYNLSIASNYIRKDRIDKNIVWKAPTEYGELDITINLSKPEKDPKAIAAAKNMKSTSYPLCLLCKENEGYKGRVNHPSRGNHRIIPIELTKTQWFIQYSPYVYYNEHCIVFKGAHEPMIINKSSFDRLLEFTELFPHYFVGSNADLPIVGGSILSHDHFQGGHYTFAMETAPIERKVELKSFPTIEAGIVKWPMSVLRISSENRELLSEAAGIILNKWRAYSDESVDVLAFTNETPHNTITPIARRRGNLYELDLVLRNNRTSDEHPLGIFHPHDEVHHIKKENIGLIEVMGLAVLPARLETELSDLSAYLIDKELILEDEELLKHASWLSLLREKYTVSSEKEAMDVLKKEVGKKFMTVLEHAGVYKRDEKGENAFVKFVESIK